MRKKILIPLLIMGAMIILFYLTFIGIQSISTDKATYSQGEEIEINVSNFSLLSTTCGIGAKIYRLENNSWKRVNKDLVLSGKTVCLDGRPSHTAWGCDVISIEGPAFKTNSITWDGKEYLQVEENTCDTEWNSSGQPIESYTHKVVAPGTYKAQIGFAETIFEIE